MPDTQEQDEKQPWSFSLEPGSPQQRRAAPAPGYTPPPNDLPQGPNQFAQQFMDRANQDDPVGITLRKWYYGKAQSYGGNMTPQQLASEAQNAPGFKDAFPNVDFSGLVPKDTKPLGQPSETATPPSRFPKGVQLYPKETSPFDFPFPGLSGWAQSSYDEALKNAANIAKNSDPNDSSAKTSQAMEGFKAGVKNQLAGLTSLKNVGIVGGLTYAAMKSGAGREASEGEAGALSRLMGWGYRLAVQGIRWSSVYDVLKDSPEAMSLWNQGRYFEAGQKASEALGAGLVAAGTFKAPKLREFRRVKTAEESATRPQEGKGGEDDGGGGGEPRPKGPRGPASPPEMGLPIETPEEARAWYEANAPRNAETVDKLRQLEVIHRNAAARLKSLQQELFNLEHPVTPLKDEAKAIAEKRRQIEQQQDLVDRHERELNELHGHVEAFGNKTIEVANKYGPGFVDWATKSRGGTAAPAEDFSTANPPVTVEKGRFGLPKGSYLDSLGPEDKNIVQAAMLAKSEGKADAAAISKRLGIGKKAAQAALDHLKAHGLIDESGKWNRPQDTLAAFRKFWEAGGHTPEEAQAELDRMRQWQREADPLERVVGEHSAIIKYLESKLGQAPPEAQTGPPPARPAAAPEAPPASEAPRPAPEKKTRGKKATAAPAQAAAPAETQPSAPVAVKQRQPLKITAEPPPPAEPVAETQQTAPPPTRESVKSKATRAGKVAAAAVTASGAASRPAPTEAPEAPAAPRQTLKPPAPGEKPQGELQVVNQQPYVHKYRDPKTGETKQENRVKVTFMDRAGKQFQYLGTDLNDAKRQAIEALGGGEKPAAPAPTEIPAEKLQKGDWVVRVPVAVQEGETVKQRGKEPMRRVRRMAAVGQYASQAEAAAAAQELASRQPYVDFGKVGKARMVTRYGEHGTEPAMLAPAGTESAAPAPESTVAPPIDIARQGSAASSKTVLVAGDPYEVYSGVPILQRGTEDRPEYAARIVAADGSTRTYAHSDPQKVRDNIDAWYETLDPKVAEKTEKLLNEAYDKAQAAREQQAPAAQPPERTVPQGVEEGMEEEPPAAMEEPFYIPEEALAPEPEELTAERQAKSAQPLPTDIQLAMEAWNKMMAHPGSELERNLQEWGKEHRGDLQPKVAFASAPSLVSRRIRRFVGMDMGYPEAVTQAAAETVREAKANVNAERDLSLNAQLSLLRHIAEAVSPRAKEGLDHYIRNRDARLQSIHEIIDQNLAEQRGLEPEVRARIEKQRKGETFPATVQRIGRSGPLREERVSPERATQQVMEQKAREAAAPEPQAVSTVPASAVRTLKPGSSLDLDGEALTRRPKDNKYVYFRGRAIPREALKDLPDASPDVMKENLLRKADLHDQALRQEASHLANVPELPGTSETLPEGQTAVPILRKLLPEAREKKPLSKRLTEQLSEIGIEMDDKGGNLMYHGYKLPYSAIRKWEAPLKGSGLKGIQAEAMRMAQELKKPAAPAPPPAPTVPPLDPQISQLREQVANLTKAVASRADSSSAMIEAAQRRLEDTQRKLDQMIALQQQMQPVPAAAPIPERGAAPLPPPEGAIPERPTIQVGKKIPKQAKEVARAEKPVKIPKEMGPPEEMQKGRLYTIVEGADPDLGSPGTRLQYTGESDKGKYVTFRELEPDGKLGPLTRIAMSPDDFAKNVRPAESNIAEQLKKKEAPELSEPAESPKTWAERFDSIDFKPSKKQGGNVFWVNHPAMEVLQRTWGELFGHEVPEGSVMLGGALERPDALATAGYLSLLGQEVKDPKVSAMADAIFDMALPMSPDAKAIFAFPDTARLNSLGEKKQMLYHEMAHSKLGSLRDYLPDLDVESIPGYGKVRDALLKIGYRDRDPSTIPDEIIAHAAALEHERLGVDKDTMFNVFADILERLKNAAGEDNAERIIRHGRPEARQFLLGRPALAETLSRPAAEGASRRGPGGHEEGVGRGSGGSGGGPKESLHRVSPASDIKKLRQLYRQGTAPPPRRSR